LIDEDDVDEGNFAKSDLPGYVVDSKCGFSHYMGNRVPYRGKNSVWSTQKFFQRSCFFADQPHFNP